MANNMLYEGFGLSFSEISLFLLGSCCRWEKRKNLSV